MEEDDIGFLYAIIVPNILTRSLKVQIESSSQPVFYKREDFLALVVRYGFFEIKPHLVDALSKTQSFLWKVKENEIQTLSFKSEPDSLLRDLLQVKSESENTVEELPLVEKFSRMNISLDDPENPIFSLF